MEVEYRYKTIEERIKSNISKYCRLDKKIVSKKDLLEVYSFIIRMAYWYYLRYPKEEIEREFKMEESVSTTWSHRLDYSRFYNSLNEKYKEYIKECNYPNLMQLFPIYGVRKHFHLDSDGLVEECESYPEIEGMDLLEVAKWAKNAGFVNYKDFIKVYKSMDIYYKKRDLLLESVMLEIIKDGGKYLGIRRALLFAREFDLDMDKALYYGISSDDEKRSEIIDFYNKYMPYDEEKKDGKILVDYLSRERNKEMLVVEHLNIKNGSILKK